MLFFLKNKFLNNSNLNILNYEINLNSKEILRDGQKLKLTEREINFILFLKKFEFSSKHKKHPKIRLELFP